MLLERSERPHHLIHFPDYELLHPLRHQHWLQQNQLGLLHLPPKMMF
jgi:hypothetical protein